MKKKSYLFLSLLLLMLITPSISKSQTYEKTLGALWYNKLCKDIPNRQIPLYTNSMQTRQLILKEYSTTQYYGSIYKSTEHPNEEWVATYTNGFLNSVQKNGGNNTYLLYYDSQNVLYKMEIYNQSTGSRIDTYSRYDAYRGGKIGGHNYGNAHFVFKGVHYDFHVFSNVSWNISATYFTDYNYGVQSSYVAIGRKDNAWGVKEGNIYKNPGWFIQNSYGVGWRRIAPERLLQRLYEAVQYQELSSWDYEVNRAGLPVRFGMPNTYAEDLQQVVYKYSNGQYIYEYIWSY